MGKQMFDRYAKTILAGIAVFFMLTMAQQRALAEGQGYKECSAKT
jgi:hypothetical protein